ncbi:MAG: protein kinase, partial [Myxococcota bacterium]
MTGSADRSKYRAPLRLGRYEVLIPIASGGMGTVYLARASGPSGFERPVAIKVMHAHLRQEQRFTEDLIEEAKLAVRIGHPNVVQVIDAGEEG